MKMIRTFHPVGQGAFYSEEFFDENGKCVFRVVYDCGSLKSCKFQRNSDGSLLTRQNIKNRLSGAFSDDHGIDVLFISHLDDDHVNLISRLKPFENHKIRTVILPLIADEEYVLAGYYLSRSRKVKAGDVVQIINDPKEYFGAHVKVVFVRPFDDERPRTEDDRRNDEVVNLEDLRDREEISSMTQISVGRLRDAMGQIPSWLFVPCNHKPERYEKFKEAFDKEEFEYNGLKRKGASLGVAMLQNSDFLMQNLSKLRNCYKKLPGRFWGNSAINCNSMMLYSGPNSVNCAFRCTVESKCTHDSRCEVEGCVFPSIGCLVHYCSDCGLCILPPIPVGIHSVFLRRPGCLYMGDASVDDAQPMKNFEQYVKCIGTVQMPHHGSLDSFGSGSLPIEGRVCVATYGERNSFGHPAFAVKRAVAQKGGLWVDVTETEESRFKVEFIVK